MAIYVWRCGECGDEREEVAPIGTARMLCRCECGARMVKVMGVGLHVAADATPSKHGDIREANAREDLWDRSMPAYKRMRERGLQPPNIDSAVALEDRVGDQLDIDYRHVLAGADTKDRDRRRERLGEATETLERHPGIVDE